MATASTLLLLDALPILGDVGAALQSTIAGMELTALRLPTPVVPPADEALSPRRPRRRASARGPSRRRRATAAAS